MGLHVLPVGLLGEAFGLSQPQGLATRQGAEEDGRTDCVQGATELLHGRVEGGWGGAVLQPVIRGKGDQGPTRLHHPVRKRSDSLFELMVNTKLVIRVVRGRGTITNVFTFERR